MKLCDIVIQAAIVPSIQATKRDDAIRELTEALAASGVIKSAQVDEVVKAIIKREKKGSTGFGHGVAVPHAKLPDVGRVFATVGISHAGLEFSALDSRPVYVAFLLLSPEDKPEEHIDGMECVFGVLTQDKFRRFLRQAKNAQEIWGLLEEADHASTSR